MLLLQDQKDQFPFPYILLHQVRHLSPPRLPGGNPTFFIVSLERGREEEREKREREKREKRTERRESERGETRKYEFEQKKNGRRKRGQDGREEKEKESCVCVFIIINNI